MESSYIKTKIATTKKRRRRNECTCRSNNQCVIGFEREEREKKMWRNKMLNLNSKGRITFNQYVFNSVCFFFTSTKKFVFLTHTAGCFFFFCIGALCNQCEPTETCDKVNGNIFSLPKKEKNKRKMKNILKRKSNGTGHFLVLAYEFRWFQVERLSLFLLREAKEERRSEIRKC